MQANILPLYTPATPRWDQKVETIFSKGHVAYQIKERSVEYFASLTLCTPLFFWAR